MIRPVSLSDAQRIAEIYNYYIKNTIITFEDIIVTEEEISGRITDIISKGFPYIVYEDESDIVGYAYLNNWRSRAAYNITLETSIYLDNDLKGKGIGTVLYQSLINEARQLKLHSLIGALSLPNEASRHLHKKLNFELIGNFKEVGQKFDKLIDVEFWQLFL